VDINKIIDIVRETDEIFFNPCLGGDVTQKGEFDFVTKADIAISDFMHKRLKEEFPDTDFMSEEEKNSITHNSYWILDPIDGTTNFMQNLGLSVVSLALCEGGDITAAVIYNPYKNELYHAQKGRGAYLNGKQIRCSQKDKLSDCLGEIELNSYFKEDYKDALAQAEKIYRFCRDVRTIGSAALSMAYVACGGLDVFLGRYLKPWDYAAGYLLICEAGGDVDGLDNKIDFTTLNQHIAAAPDRKLLDDFKNLLKGEN